MKKIKNIINKLFIFSFKKPKTKIEFKENEVKNLDIKEIPLSLFSSLIEEEFKRKEEEMKKEDMKRAMMEFGSRVNSSLSKFVNLYHEDPEITKNLSVREFQEEIATSLAVQSFVRKVNFSLFEVDQLSDTAIIGFEIFPSNEILEDVDPMIIKMNVESASNTFGKGFTGEGNPFYEGK